jgi:hypothetical protein
VRVTAGQLFHQGGPVCAWWLTGADFEAVWAIPGHGAVLGTYQLLVSTAASRGTQGQLWLEHNARLPPDAISWPDTPVAAMCRRRVGVVLPVAVGRHLRYWPGFITDMNLRPWTGETEDDNAAIVPESLRTAASALHALTGGDDGL